jgi:hypothetical protein
MLFFQGRGTAELSSDRKTNPETDADPDHNTVETADAEVTGIDKLIWKNLAVLELA